MSRPVLAMTVGDPVGIGPEIAVRTLLEYGGDDRAHGIAVGDAGAIQRAVDVLGVDATIRVVDEWTDEPADESTVDVFDIGVLGDDLPQWGVVDGRAGRAAVTAIEVAADAAMNEKVAGIVTGPINKEAIWASGSEFLGHTEMLGHLTGVSMQDTMFVVRHRESGHPLRIFFATRHLSLADALKAIDVDSQVGSIRRAYRALEVFGVDVPRLAVAAINPHGGEGGHFGREEIDVLTPAIEQVVTEDKVRIDGPIPADSVFFQGLEGRYDGILSQYHDQGHIASKTYDFHGTVSVTVGLPILRTSVDHGTAFDIAGTGKADHSTMKSAFEAAIEFAPFASRIRAEYLPS